MFAFYARRKWIIFALIGLIGCVCSFEIWSRWITAVPLSEPIALSSAGNIDKELEIRRDCTHSLELAFSKTTRLGDDVATLVSASRSVGIGSGKAFDGVRIPLQWSLIDPAGRVITSGCGDAAGSHAWSSTEFYRPVVSSLRLPRGKYRLRAALVSSVPELNGMSARLTLGCHNGKLGSGWQYNLLLFGQLIKNSVILPLSAILAAILLGLETSHLGPSYKRR
ncbi:hypothetical protein FV218_21535 [Methylobacterium sp. WL69]|uniref:DUF5625 family protein n=1 Tax=Methylobacterium sp. WL69 TaxID=2603893 RepID=UPI0011CB5905|nr:DUF5625 family protein [Methylobacterium sp. WL69]TXM65182.1 hypothetical protein FV218_21535 [Methylobacterium sp. WL69]